MAGWISVLILFLLLSGSAHDFLKTKHLQNPTSNPLDQLIQSSPIEPRHTGLLEYLAAAKQAGQFVMTHCFIILLLVSLFFIWRLYSAYLTKPVRSAHLLRILAQFITFS